MAGLPREGTTRNYSAIRCTMLTAGGLTPKESHCYTTPLEELKKFLPLHTPAWKWATSRPRSFITAVKASGLNLLAKIKYVPDLEGAIARKKNQRLRRAVGGFSFLPDTPHRTRPPPSLCSTN